MSGVEIDSTEYVPVDRWRRLGRIDAIRKRVRRVAIGAGVVFLGLTVAQPSGDSALLVGVVRLLSLVTGVSAWSMSEALKGAADDDGDDSILAAVGVLVLVGLAWSAGRSRAGALVWRVLLGEVAASATGTDARGTAVTTDAGPTESMDMTADAGRMDMTADAGNTERPGGTYLGILAVLLIGGAVALASLPRAGAGGIDPGQMGGFLLLTAVVGGIVGLLAALSLG